jgi:ATP-binding cassette subfamily C protein
MIEHTTGKSVDPRSMPASETSFAKSVMRFLSSVVDFARPRLASTLTLIALGALLDGVGILLIVPLLGVIESAGPTGRLHHYARTFFAFAGVETRVAQLGLLLGIFAVLMLVRAAIILARDVRLSELQIGFVEEQRSRVMKRLAQARWDQLSTLRHARITDLMSGDIQRIGVAVQFMLQSGVSLMMLVVQAAIAFVLSPVLAAIIIAFLVAGSIGLVAAMRSARTLGGFVTRVNLMLLDIATQFLGGLKLAVSQNLQASFVREFEDTLRRLRDRQIGFIRQRTRSRLAIATLVALVGALAVFVGVGLLNIPPQIVIVMLLILARMNGPAMQLAQGAQQFANSLPAFDKVVELESELRPDNTSATAQPHECLHGDIVFSDVFFRHPGGRGVAGLNLAITPESFVGIGGESGAGKSTFADLLIGLIMPQQGTITVGTTILSGSASLIAWREQSSYVAQDPFLFHDTIRRNLAWANSAATEGDMWRALAVCGAEDLVRSMPGGLDSVVGERGTLVSGGERQRLALARALLRDPSMLLLDEATNAIDIASESAILERIRNSYPRMTIVLIAHRRESLALCDRVLRMENGQILDERGSSLHSTVTR